MQLDSYSEKLSGVIVSDNEPKKINAFERSEIGSIMVKVGDFVSEGQILATLSDPVLNVELEQTRFRLIDLEKKLQRELLGAKIIEQRIQLTEALITQKQASLVTTLEGEKLSLAKAQLDATSPLLKNLDVLSHSLGQDLIKLGNLSQLSTIDRIEYLDKAHSIIGRITDIRSQLDSATINSQQEKQNAEIEMTELSLKLLDEKNRLIQAESQIAVTQQTLRESQSKVNELTIEQERLKLVSPADGTVTYISSNLTESNIVEAQETLLVITPHEYNLYAELYLNDKQYKDVVNGNDVSIEVYAWNHHKHGVSRGRIDSVTRSKISSAHYDKPSFIARVSLFPEKDSQIVLERGFTFNARVKLEKVSVFEYLIRKIKSDV